MHSFNYHVMCALIKFDNEVVWQIILFPVPHYPHPFIKSVHACHFVLNIVQRYSGIFCISQAKHLNIILNIKTLFSYDRAHKENIYTLWNATPWSSFFFKTLGIQFFYLNFPLKNYDKFRLHVLKNKSQFCGKYFNNFFLQKQFIYKLITFPK